MTAQSTQQQSPPRDQEVRVAELQRQASKDYASGQEVREGLDRAYVRRLEMWGRV
ncbi:hypothetical protein [Streptomyces sp. NPDC102437]|uniref:hypothetical protein n=1 Tax=Streptomyces sp. NPDC102437 TaxID=3366175 RepID=UPI0037F145AE